MAAGKGIDPWQTTVIGRIWSKGWDKGFAKGSKGKGGAYGGWAKPAAPVVTTATAAKASSVTLVVPKATAAQTRVGVALLQLATELLDQANTRIQHQGNVIDVLANRVSELEDQLAAGEP
jgi:hypothetical protein